MEKYLENKKQAIEEMALIICGFKDCTSCISRMGLRKCGAKAYAERFYNADYRKQAWISVEERLPKKWKHVLCYYPEKDYGSKVVVDYAETDDGYFAEQYLFGKPSHWMPLPEPPSAMKGE